MQNAPDDPDFDLETRTKAWAAVEAEMKAITRQNEADAEKATELQISTFGLIKKSAGK